MTSTAVKTRGKTKSPEGNWSAADMPKSVIRLAEDTSDPQVRRRVEQFFSATFQVRRSRRSIAVR
ncbi:MAG: hypothetical protein ACR2HR_03245 [Euzebya sp.]